jgi:pentatricopeptide repeat protein
MVSGQFSAVMLRDPVHGERKFRRQTAFDRPSSIIALFLSGKKAHFLYGTAAKSKFGLSGVVLPDTLRHRQSLENGKFFGTASTSQADFDLAEPQVGDEEEKEGGKSGQEQRMDSGLADSDLDELDNNSTSDCPEANDALVIQRLFKANPTCEARVEALKQCGITVSTDLVLRVLSRYKSDMNIAMYFFMWASQQPSYSHGTETYNAMLNILGRMKQFKTMWQLVEEMHNGGNGPSLVTDETFTILIRRYAAAHMVERASEAFYKREEFGLKLNTPAFQILLGALCRYKHVQEAEAFLNLRQNEFPPDMKSLNIILNGWCALGNLREAKRFWNELIKKGHKPNLVTYGTFINALTKLGGLHEALKLFEAMWNKGCIPDVLICNNIIDALCSKKRIPEALVIFGEMNDHGCLPDIATYNSLIKHICNIRGIDKAYKLFYEMERKGCAPNSRTYHYFLSGAKEPKEALKVFQRMMKSGCMPTSDTYNLMLRMLIAWNDMDMVFRLWDDMERKGMGPDRRSYTVMIHGLYKNGRFDEAYKCYNEMATKGLLLEPRTKILVKAMEIKAKESKTGVHNTKKKKKQDKSSSRVKTKIA